MTREVALDRGSVHIDGEKEREGAVPRGGRG